jgi:hypothetical protein
MKNTVKILFFALLAVAALQSCTRDTEYPDPTPANEASSLRFKMLFCNAGVQSPDLNVLLNNEVVGSNLRAYSNLDYVSFPAGIAQIRAKAATGTIGGTLGSSDLLFRAGATNNNNFTAPSGRNYTTFITDTLNRPRPTTIGATDPGGLRFLVVEDNLAAPAVGKAHVRFYHLAPGAPAVWVGLKDSTTAIFNDRRYRATSQGTAPNVVNFNAFVPVNAGIYDFDVHTGSATGPVALSIPNVTLEAGKIYTIYAKGKPGLADPHGLGAAIIQHN